jgi:hypothetical protein
VVGDSISIGTNCEEVDGKYRYVTFIVDGKEMTLSDISNLGEIVGCHTFAYRECSTIYAPPLSVETSTTSANNYSVGRFFMRGNKVYKVTATIHSGDTLSSSNCEENSSFPNPDKRTYAIPIAKHTKLTEFIDGGFRTTNYIEMEYDESAFTNGINIHTAFTGLFCVASPFAQQTIGDTGMVFTGVHPTSNAILGDNPLCKYSRRVKMLNGNKSCEIDSKVLFSNITGYNPPPLNTHVNDRATDLKYYSYFTIRNGVTGQGLLPVANGSFFATEGTIRWSIR